MVIMQVPRGSYRGYRARVESMGVRLVWEPGEDRDDTGGVQLHPKDVAGAIAEIRWNAEEEQADGAWWPAGRDWQRAKHTEIVDAITAAEIQSPRPRELAARWGAVLEEPVSTDAEGHAMLALDGTDLRFVPIRDSRPEGLAGLDVRATNGRVALENADKAGCLAADGLIMVCGMRFRLV